MTGPLLRSRGHRGRASAGRWRGSGFPATPGREGGEALEADGPHRRGPWPGRWGMVWLGRGAPASESSA